MIISFRWMNLFFMTSCFQVYGHSPTNDDINQNLSLHPSNKTMTNVFASTFFGELSKITKNVTFAPTNFSRDTIVAFSLAFPRNVNFQ